MAQYTYLKIGELLIKEGVLSEEQLNRAILFQKKEGGRLGEILLKLSLIKEAELAAVLGKQLKIPYATPDSGLLHPAKGQNLENLVPKDFAIKNLILPISKNLNSLTCAIFDPLELTLLDNIKKITHCEINPVIATKSDILNAIEKFYGQSDLLENAVTESYGIADEDAGLKLDIETETSLSLDKIVAMAEDAPVVKLVDLIVRQAILERCSDIHIEPGRKVLRLRYRIDGKLYDIPPPAKHMQLAIISRIKILSKLDIAEKRLPQDGAFTVRLEERSIDLRVSVIPTIYGEKIVIRILDRSDISLDFSSLDLDSKQIEDFKKAIGATYGLIFITGPTGSGKTTTLYVALNEIKDPAKNIITVEDPVEYRLDGVNQVQIRPEIGLNFAAALRSFLRQDPDVMLVGEVRDLETAEICVRSALTGHLVLSTLHTNDAPSTVTRLVDIGVEPYLLIPSLLMVVAQRLCRRLCPDCKEAYEPLQSERVQFNIKSDLIYKAKGCQKCNQIGYRGRLPIMETMPINKEFRSRLSKQDALHNIKNVAIELGMETLLQNGLKKVEKGLTSLQEVLSITAGIE